MKHCIIIVGLFILFVTPLAAQNRDLKTEYKKWLEGDGFVLTGGYEFEGKNYRYDLKMEDFDGTPKWEPSSGNPPLSLEKAYGIATREFKELVGDQKPWSIFKIELVKLPGVSDAWYFQVNFFYTAGDSRGSTFDIIVRMDGKPILPKLTPKTTP